jgi:hypothetical protein
MKKIYGLSDFFELRTKVLELFKVVSKAFIYDGDLNEHPIAQEFFDPTTRQRVAGFDTWWMDTGVWKKIVVDTFGEYVDCEGVLIRAAPGTVEECLTEVHFHDGATIITVLGESFKFPNPQTTLFRGLAKLDNIRDPLNTRFHLERFRTIDGGATLVGAWEPHTFLTKKDTETFAFAVTVGPPFKDDSNKVDATIIPPENCYIIQREKRPLLEVAAESYQ